MRSNISPNLATEAGFYLIMNSVYGSAESAVAHGPFQTYNDAVHFHDDQLICDDEGLPISQTDEGCSNMCGHPIRFSFKPGPLRDMNPLQPSELHGALSPWGHGILELRETRALGWFPGKENS